MAITSIGYGNTIVPDTSTAKWLPRAGMSHYGVAGWSDWRPTIGGAGNRAVTIAAGVGWGWNIVDTNSAPAVVNVPSVGSGQRYDLIVAHRDWGTGTTTFAVVEGGSAKVIPPRDTNPGVEDDQPIAVVRVAAGNNSVLELWDVRVIPAPQGFAVDPMVLSYFDEVGTSLRLPPWGSDRETVATRYMDGGVEKWGFASVEDTFWATSLSGIVYSEHFALESMRIRRRQTRVTGRLSVRKLQLAGKTAAESTVTTGADGALSSQLNMFWLPSLWRPDDTFPVDIRGTESNNPFTGLIEPGGRVALTHGPPNRSIAPNARLTVYFDHLVGTA